MKGKLLVDVLEAWSSNSFHLATKGSSLSNLWPHFAQNEIMIWRFNLHNFKTEQRKVIPNLPFLSNRHNKNHIKPLTSPIIKIRLNLRQVQSVEQQPRRIRLPEKWLAVLGLPETSFRARADGIAGYCDCVDG